MQALAKVHPLPVAIFMISFSGERTRLAEPAQTASRPDQAHIPGG
jgi:hypothetical protein